MLTPIRKKADIYYLFWKGRLISFYAGGKLLNPICKTEEEWEAKYYLDLQKYYQRACQAFKKAKADITPFIMKEINLINTYKTNSQQIPRIQSPLNKWAGYNPIYEYHQHLMNNSLIEWPDKQDIGLYRAYNEFEIFLRAKLLDINTSNHSTSAHLFITQALFSDKTEDQEHFQLSADAQLVLNPPRRPQESRIYLTEEAKDGKLNIGKSKAPTADQWALYYYYVHSASGTSFDKYPEGKMNAIKKAAMERRCDADNLRKSYGVIGGIKILNNKIEKDYITAIKLLEENKLAQQSAMHDLERLRKKNAQQQLKSG